jgi:hypothetical protein
LTEDRGVRVEELAGATGLEPAASCVTGRHLSRSVNNLLISAHEFSSEYRKILCVVNRQDFRKEGRANPMNPILSIQYRIQPRLDGL